MRKWVQIDEETEVIALKVPKAVIYEEYPRMLYLKKGGTITVHDDEERHGVEALHGKWSAKPTGPFDCKIPEPVADA